MELNPTFLCAKKAHTKTITQVVFSHKGNQLASCSTDATVKIWDVKNFTAKVPARKLVGHTAEVNSVAFSKNSKMIVSGGADQTVRVWLNGRDAPSTAIGVANARSIVRSLDFGLEDSIILCAADSINVWKVEGLRPHTTFKGHTNWVRCAKFNSDSQQVVSCSDDKTVRLWDTQTRKNISIMDHHAKWVTFDGRSKYVASAGIDKHIVVWDPRCLSPATRILAHDDVINCVDFFADGLRLVSASNDRTIKIWDMRKQGTLLFTLEGHNEAPACCVFSPLSTHMASASDHLILWSLDEPVAQQPTKPEMIADERPLRVTGTMTPQPSVPPLPATPPPYPIPSDTHSIPEDNPHLRVSSSLSVPPQSSIIVPPPLSSSIPEINERRPSKSSLDAELVATLRLIMHKVEDLDHVVETMSHRVDKTQGLISIIQSKYDIEESATDQGLMEELRLQVDSLEEKNSELISHIHKIVDKNKELEEEAKRTRDQNNREREKEENELKKKLDEVIKQKEIVEEELKKSSEHRQLTEEQAKEQNEKWEREMAQIKHDLNRDADVARQAEEARKQIRELQLHLDKEVKNNQIEREKWENEKNELEIELEKFKQEKDETNDLRDKLDDAKREIDHLNDELSSTKDKENLSRNAAAVLEKECTIIQEKLEEKDGEIVVWKQKTKDLKREAEEGGKRGDDEIKRLREELFRAREEINQAKGRWREKEARSMKEFQENKENAVTGIKAELEVMNERKMAQIQDEHKRILHAKEIEIEHAKVAVNTSERERTKLEKTLARETERYNTVINEEQRKTEELREQKSILEGQVRELRELVKQLQDNRLTAQEEISSLRVRVDSLTTTEFDLQQIIQDEQAKTEEREEKIKELEDRAADLTVRLEQLSVAHDEINESYNQSQQHNRQLTEDLAMVKEHIGLESKVRSEAEISVSRLNKHVSELTKVEETLEDELAEERARRADADDEITVLRGRLDAMKKLLSVHLRDDGRSTPKPTLRETSFMSRDSQHNFGNQSHSHSRHLQASRAEITRETSNAEGELSASDLAVKIYHRR